MRRLLVPFSVPSKLEADLARVRAYWEGLKRGGAGMPFWDDVNLAALPGLSGRLMLLDVFDKPLRFRFGIVGEELKARYRADVSPAGSRMSSKSVIHSSTSILKPLPRSRVVPRHITATRRPSAASLARKRDMLGSFSRSGEMAASGCSLGLSLGDSGLSRLGANSHSRHATDQGSNIFLRSALRPSWREEERMAVIVTLTVNPSCRPPSSV